MVYILSFPRLMCCNQIKKKSFPILQCSLQTPNHLNETMTSLVLFFTWCSIKSALLQSVKCYLYLPSKFRITWSDTKMKLWKFAVGRWGRKLEHGLVVAVATLSLNASCLFPSDAVKYSTLGTARDWIYNKDLHHCCHLGSYNKLNVHL